MKLFHDIRLKKPLDLEHIMTEYEYANHIRLLGRTNKVYKSYIGLGYNNCSASNSKKYFWKPDGTLLTHHTKQKLHKEDWSNFKFPNYSYWVNWNGSTNASLLDSTAAAEAMALLFDVRTRDQRKQMFVNSLFLKKYYHKLYQFYKLVLHLSR
jgi:glycine dehydrogenase